MWRGVVERVRDTRERLGRTGGFDVGEIRRWLERTENLRHVSIVLFVPLLIGAVTMFSENTRLLSFLLYPPLASGTYTLFANPEGTYSSPVKFVAGLTLGALSGWLALEVAARFLYHVPPGQFQIHAGSAALAVFFTAVMSWGLDLEEPSAFSTALLVLATDASKPAYVATVALSSAVVAAVFVVWRERFYQERARYLYKTTGADDHVLVPMRGETARETAMFGARIAAAHDASKVVLLDVVADEERAAAQRSLLGSGGGGAGDGDEDESGDVGAEAPEAVRESAAALERRARRIETEVGVPCEVVVAAGGVDRAATTLTVTEEANCDLVVAPFEEERGSLSEYLRALFRSDVDVVAFRSTTGETRWQRSLVMVRRAGDVAHAMVDYAGRLAGPTGLVSICTCIERENERRRSESMLASLAEPVASRCETRVSRSSVVDFLERNAAQTDVVFVGASTHRSAASRFVAPPTFQRLDDVETDVAIVHTG